MVEMRRALARGRHAHAALELGIAFELLIATIVREVGPLRGDCEAKVARILDAGLKNVLKDHLPRLTGLAVDLDNVENVVGRWRRDAYDLRNRVIHSGYRPTYAEVNRAREAVGAVIDALYAALRSDPVTEELSGMLSTPASGTDSSSSSGEDDPFEWIFRR